MMTTAFLFTILAAGLLLVRGDVTDIATPDGVCLQSTGSGVNVRDAACGNVVGQMESGQVYTSLGGEEDCDLSGTTYDFHQFDYAGAPGAWTAGDYLTYTRSSQCASVEPPSSEWRGVWVATVTNIDWPISSSDPPSKQQQDALDSLDLTAALNFNAVVFQVRPVGDAFYSSDIEPWSAYLTGSQGLPPDPLWDPLDFWVTEAHSRDIELHAWLNPYRANLQPNSDGLAANHMAMEYPEYAYAYGNYLWMDPGAQVVIDRILTVIEDIIRRYDVDGIHFDDYFYPYPVDGVDFPDDATYQDYVSGGGTLSREDWRRNNVNVLVETCWNLIGALNTELGRSVKLSISPFGIYRPGDPDGMPAPIVGLDPYTALYADSKLWVQQGWMHFLVPQLYWETMVPAQSYPTLAQWWATVCHGAGVQFYAGNGVYRLDDSDWPIEEIGLQVDISRALSDESSLGNCHFSFRQIRDNVKGIQSIFQEVYPSKATVPYQSRNRKNKIHGQHQPQATII